jgi:hypothetical protein
VGTRLTLLTRLPDTWGDLCDVALPVEVRSNRQDPPDGPFRVGCRLHADQEVRDRLVEYCFVVLPARSRGVAPVAPAERVAS